MAELTDFFTMVRGFLTVFLPRVRCASPHTIRSYTHAINLFRRYLADTHGLTLTTVTFDAVTQASVTGFLGWLTSRGANPATANQRFMALKSFLSYCAGQDPRLVAVYLDIQHVRRVRQPGRALDALSVDAVEALLAAPGQASVHAIRDTFFLILLFDTAARVQELLDLTIGDFTLDTRHPGVHLTGKGRKTRYLPVADSTIAHLRAHLAASFPQGWQPDDLVFFTTRDHRHHPMSQDNVAYFLKRHADQARLTRPDIPATVHAHQFRHARAQQLFRAGVPLVYIKEFLGHASITTTNIYATVDPDMLRDTLDKANPPTQPTAPLTPDDEDHILRLCGLK